jgi:hypothetical protein
VKKAYQVTVLCQTQLNYLVDAETPVEAEVAALNRWVGGDKGETLGDEWTRIEKYTTVEKATSSSD